MLRSTRAAAVGQSGLHGLVRLIVRPIIPAHGVSPTTMPEEAQIVGVAHGSDDQTLHEMTRRCSATSRGGFVNPLSYPDMLHKVVEMRYDVVSPLLGNHIEHATGTQRQVAETKLLTKSSATFRPANDGLEPASRRTARETTQVSLIHRIATQVLHGQTRHS
ncbi:hypothetical protein C8034_v002155 [Colletotrichum sidae]|uniref:Uncharacterized protein n=1 Tax=Colletotrichum sidae TaxID=1347389 RepID=A0A4R8TSQ8_9PEZI|nr:hypothetical protein C8034_v002155 [Colletotrichum sidae]